MSDVSSRTEATIPLTRTAGRTSSRSTEISRVPYLPGLDGMRALAVVAVMVYHANPDWLPGGFLGVEVFFVISGYLITLLLIAEKERSYTVDMKQFWYRRGRRLLPALFTLLILLTIWTSIFERDALGKLRGDVIAALLYVSNWYQIWTGAGYTASNDFAPLRHLWSLAVEEQFYLIWPIVMVALLRGGSRKIADLSRWLFLTAVALTVLMAVLFYSGPIGSPEVTPDAYWHVFGRDLSIDDTLYLSTITRASGLLLGAAFAMIWRPVAVMRGPLREKGRLLDGVSLLGFLGLAAMTWWVGLIKPSGADSFLFRGGFFLCAIATLMMVAAVTHERAFTSRILSIPVLLWIGTRSYGLYLFHWPIYQFIRNIAGKPLVFHEFVLAMVATGIVTEISYRYIETPIRRGTFGEGIRRIRSSPVPGPRNALLAGGLVVGGLTVYASVGFVTAEVQENAVAESLDEGAESVCNLLENPDCVPGTTVADDGAVATDAPDTSDATATTDPAVVPGSSEVPESSAAVDPAATTTTVAEPTTTVASGPIPQLALGDSVMLGAAGELADLGFIVDATESRAFINGLDTILTLNQQGRLGDVVVVHLGTNGPISSSEMTRMMEALAGVPQVLLVTNDLPAVEKYDYAGPNNALLYDAASAYPNVSLMDWAGLVANCPGNCKYDDEIHLRPDGQTYYATLVAQSLGLG